jgi:pimeloyl-ACP methyl ester carboxylesterase
MVKMREGLPFLLIPGLLCTARLYQHQVPALSKLGATSVVDHTQDDSIAAIAARALKTAPPRFHIVALSMGGYIAFEILRQAQDRVEQIALLDTSARPETPPATERRLKLIALAEDGKFQAVKDTMFPLFVHANRVNDAALRAEVDKMADETGPEAFVRQQRALMVRPDARPLLPQITRKTLVMVGDADRLIPPEQSEEIATGIAGAGIEYVRDCGHLSTLEQPQAVTHSLLRFFGG